MKNVEIPLFPAGANESHQRDRATTLLKRAGFSDRLGRESKENPKTEAGRACVFKPAETVICQSMRKTKPARKGAEGKLNLRSVKLDATAAWGRFSSFQPLLLQPS